MPITDSRKLVRVVTLFVALVVLGFAPLARAQSGAGTVTGTVTDAVTGAPLAGADVVLDGTSFIGATDRSGAFRLLGVPAGEYQLLVVYLGHKDERASITVTGGRSLQVEVKLAPASFSETVTVTAESIAEGQASALNQQKSAPNITNVIAADQIGAFPDPNAAEAASRVPGVSIERDQGEGRYVLVRGTEARLNSMMINGERIPSPEGDVRNVALDAVPADQLQAIEVTKALTPDMDADAIGGAVNLITRQAVSRPTLLFSAAGGYNALQKDAGQRQMSGTVGRRVADGKVGLLFSGSSASLDRGSENFEAEYDDGDLYDFQLRDYVLNRERHGLNGAADFRLSNDASLTFRAIYNKFKDDEARNSVRYRLGNGRIERGMKNRNQNQTIQSLSATGQHLVAGRTTVDYKLAWAFAEEHQPDRLDTIFRQSKVSYAPNVTPSSIDPENIQPNPLNEDISRSTLNEQVSQIFRTQDRDVTGSFNVRTPIGSSSGFAGVLKFGAKVRDKRKDREYEEVEGSPDGTVPFSQLQDQAFDSTGFMSFFPAGYVLGPGIDTAKARAYFNALPASEREINHEGDAENYDASEKVYAGYGMGEFSLGRNLQLVAGFRYESTKVEYKGYDVLYNDDGDYESTRPVTGGDTYGFFLPSFHLKYAVTPSTSLRAALTRTLARPNYYDLVPYQLVFQEDSEIERGNASLKPTASTNVDLLAEHYFSTVGVVSGGFFYKRLSDYVFPFRIREQAFGDIYEVTQPQNGDSASVWGLEFAFQNQLRSLPAPFDGLGLMANYTWTGSSTTFPERAETSSLPGQSAHVGNVSVWYEKRGASVRASWNFHGKFISEVGPSDDQDVYYDNHAQLDLNVGYRLTRNIQVYADFLNLTNAPLRYYIGTSDRPIQQEYYRWWTMAGVRVNF